MATRSRIGILRKDGTVTSIYCHWDGYASHNGKVLLESYTDQDKIEDLLFLGDISVLRGEIGEKHDFDDGDLARDNDWVTAYGRDREETEIESHTHADIEEFLGHGEEYNYLYIPSEGELEAYAGLFGTEEISGRWWVSSYDEDFITVEEAIRRELEDN
jgi:hypothetical protein